MAYKDLRDFLKRLERNFCRASSRERLRRRARILRISERTVKFHVGNILEKLHMSSREDLSAKWVPDLGLV